MKNLIKIVTVSLVLTVSTLANVECVKEGKYWRPSNEVAKDIAKALKVKTCTGERFQATVKKLGMTSNVVGKVGAFNETDLLKKYKK